MKLLKMAFRNIFRNRQRTLLTTGAAAFAGFIMIFYSALMEGMIETFERNVVTMTLGDIQIHSEGYRDDQDIYKLIPNHEELVRKIEDIGFHASPRLYGFGLAASGSASSGAWLRGINMEHEPDVTQIHLHLGSGSWLDGSDSKGVVIGKKLARTLDVKVGGEVIILSQAADGSMANDLYRVRGILKSVADGIDRTGFYMLESEFRSLMFVMEGVHEIAVMRKDRTEDLQTATENVYELAPELEVKNWRELQPVISEMIDLNYAGLVFMILITYTAIAMVILNAMLMSVFERIREFGVMKAIGVSPWQVAVLIFYEAIIQSVAAGTLAVLFGVPVSLYYQDHGIDLSVISGGGTIMGVAFDPIMYCRLTASSVITPVIFLLIITALAVIYPAIKAAVIRPVQAIRHL